MPIAAVILAAGKGTRMKSNRPKVAFTLAGTPLVRRVYNTAVKLDTDLFAVVVGHRRDDVIACLPRSEKIHYVEQTEQLGTGHAVLTAAPALKDFTGEVLILCGDVPLITAATLQNLVNIHRREQAACTVLTAYPTDPARYGRIVRDEHGQVARIVEFKDATPTEREIGEINTGIYCFDSARLLQALQLINNNNAQNEYYLTDTLQILRDQGYKVPGVVLPDMYEAAGINSQTELSALELEHYRRVRQNWLDTGVQMENPETILIGDDVELAQDVFLGQGVILHGHCVIPTGCYIGPYSILQDARLAPYCRLTGRNTVADAALSGDLGWGERVLEG